MAALDLEHFLPYRLSVLSNRVSQAIARTYEQRFGLSVTEWRVIAIIGRYPGLPHGTRARRTRPRQTPEPTTACWRGLPLGRAAVP